jgi:mannose-6-phosphate isomerase-like protein (cupin superfamily)
VSLIGIKADKQTSEGNRMRPRLRRANPSQEFETPERCWILEIANDKDDDELSISRARVSSGVTTEWHELRDTDKRYVIVNGNGYVEVGGLLSARVQPGGIVQIPANTTQHITNTGQEDLVFYCICTPRSIPHCYVRRSDLEDSEESCVDEQ